MRSYNKSEKMTIVDKAAIAAIGIGALYIATVPISHFSRDSYKALVTEKVVKRHTESSDKYLIFTQLEDGSTRVFENTDSLLEGKFGSSDVQAEIKTGNTYEFKTYGWRVPILSWYENILEAKPIDSQLEKK